MKHLITAVAMCCAMLAANAADKPAAATPATPATPATAATPAVAAAPAAPTDKAPSAKQTSQQNKMKTCNANAKGKTGDERKVFMKTCLSAKA